MSTPAAYAIIGGSSVTPSLYHHSIVLCYTWWLSNIPSLPEITEQICRFRFILLAFRDFVDDLLYCEVFPVIILIQNNVQPCLLATCYYVDNAPPGNLGSLCPIPAFIDHKRSCGNPWTPPIIIWAEQEMSRSQAHRVCAPPKQYNGFPGPYSVSLQSRGTRIPAVRGLGGCDPRTSCSVALVR